MTREEYIKDLVSQNITGREIVELASQFNEEEEEVKTDDVVAQDATVTSTNQEASESLDGTSLSEEEKATAAVEAKENKDRIDSLYQKYKIDAEEPFFNKSEYQAEQANTNVSLEEKEKWLKNNSPDFKALEESVEKQKKTGASVYNPASYISDWVYEAVFDSDREKLERAKEDKELIAYNYNNENEAYEKEIDRIEADASLTNEQRIKMLELNQPPELVYEREEVVEITKTADLFTGSAASIAKMTEDQIQSSPMFLTNGEYDPKKREDYDLYMDYTDSIDDKKVERNRMINKKDGTVYASSREEYLKLSKEIGDLDKKRVALTEPYDKEKRSGDSVKKETGLTGEYYTEKRLAQDVNQGAVALADTYLLDDFGSIGETEEVDKDGNVTKITAKENLDRSMKESYRKFVKEDPILKAEWARIQKNAASKVEAYKNEIQKTTDLTTPEGVADANAKLQAYAKKITLDEFENSKGYKKRMTDLGTVMDRAMAAKSKAYSRSQDKFLQFTDFVRGGDDSMPFNDTLANLIEGVTKGGINLVASAEKAYASVEARRVRNIQRKINAIDQRVEDGEISKEEGEKLKNAKTNKSQDLIQLANNPMNSLIEELMERKEEVEKSFDNIENKEAYTSMFKSADLSDGISFQDAILTTAEALPQIGLAALGALSTNPILAGLGTAAMFTQMYGDNYWNAYQEGIKKDARAIGLDLNSMSKEDRRDFEINALNEGKHANMATSAAFAAVMTAAEQFGAKGIFNKTKEALGLGKEGLVSFFKGSWKESGDALLRGAINKFQAGSTEFATEFAQEVLGQVSTGIQSGDTTSEYIDWGASLESGKAGGIVGVMIPFASSVATQSAVEIRNISRDVAIKFAPNSEYGKFSLETKKYFEDAQTNLDNKLKNNELTKEQHEEESANLADTRNSSLKIDSNTDQQNRAIQLDLMVKRNQLQRKIKKH